MDEVMTLTRVVRFTNSAFFFLILFFPTKSPTTLKTKRSSVFQTEPEIIPKQVILRREFRSTQKGRGLFLNKNKRN